MPVSFDALSFDTTNVQSTVLWLAFREDGAFLEASTSTQMVFFTKDGNNDFPTSRTDTGLGASEYGVPAFRTGVGVNADFCLMSSGATLYYVNWDGTKYVYTSPNSVFGLGANPNDIDIHPTIGDHVAVGVIGNIYAIDLKSGSGGPGGINTSPLDWNYGSGTWYGVKYSPDGVYLAATQSGSGLHVFKRNGDTYNEITVVSRTASFIGSVDWSPDSNQIIVGSRGGGAGFVVYNLTATDTFTRDTSTTYGPASGGCVARYINNNLSSILAVSDAFGVAAKLYSRSGTVLTEETLSVSIPQGIKIAVCRDDPTLVAVSLATTPYLALYNVEEVAEQRFVEGELVYPTFASASFVQVPATSDGDQFTYPVFGLAGELDLPIALLSSLTYPGFQIESLAGAFPKNYPIHEWKVSAVVAISGSMDMAIADPEPFTFGDWTFSQFRVEAIGNVDSEAAGALVYPSYQILGGNNPDIEGVWAYPIYGISAELLNEVKANSAIAYPMFGSDIQLLLTSGSDGDEWRYAGYRWNGVVSTTNINADLMYPAFKTDGLVAPYEVAGDLQYPLYGFDAEVVETRRFEGDFEYSTFQVSGEASLPVWTVMQSVYPKYGLVGELDAPIGITNTDFLHPKYKTDGLGGVMVSVKDTNMLYPNLRFAGEVGLTTSIDAIVLYPKYQWDGLSTNVPIAEDVEWIYPSFGAAIEAENYYGADVDVAFDHEVEADVERQKSRRHLLITEN